MVVDKRLGQHFCYYYQPQFSLATGKLRGYESLIRLIHPVRGVLGPGEFLDRIDNLGSWRKLWPVMLNQLVVDSERLEQKRRLAVNVSPVQLEDGFFLDFVEGMVLNNILDPACIEIEITENVVISDYGRVREAICRFNELNISVVIDDFGSGFSNLGHLDKLNVQGIKLDRGFITGIENSDVKQIIVESVVNIARVKKCFVLAEGIEKLSEMETVLELGCDLGQGFFLGKPNKDFICSVKSLTGPRAETRSLYERPTPGEHVDAIGATG